MKLNQKEIGLLNDLCCHEKLCIEKYQKYSSDACAGELKNLFCTIAQTEKEHLDSLNSMLGGTEPQSPTSFVSQTGFGGGCSCYCDERSKQIDSFLCRDALANEKHVSSVYDTCIFEFCDTAVRNKLNHIQSEEQKHGELIYGYMSQNGINE